MIALVGVHSPEYQALADLTWGQNKALYCRRHGFIGEDKLTEIHPKFSFEKFLLAKNYFTYADVEWVWGTGTDSMITDFTNDLSALTATNASFLVATDRNGINADSFLIRNSIKGNHVLQWLLQRMEDHLDEQAAINSLFCSNAFEPGVLEIVPQRAINSYNYNLYPNPEDRFDKLGNDGQWQYGDLLIHWPGFTANPERRVVWAKEYLNKVKYE